MASGLQLSLGLRAPPAWGGARAGAGRKPNRDSGVPHLPRPELSRHHPVHVTLRTGHGCWNLRSRRALLALQGAFGSGRRGAEELPAGSSRPAAAKTSARSGRVGQTPPVPAASALQPAARRGGAEPRPEFRLVHYSVQGNHVHLIVEAADKRALSRGMQALAIRMARALNRMMQRRGSVFADRFHAHVLRTRREVAHALRYVFGNFARHARGWGVAVGAAFCDPFSSVQWFAAAVPGEAPVAAPRTWLLRIGWRDAG